MVVSVGDRICYHLDLLGNVDRFPSLGAERMSGRSINQIVAASETAAARGGR